MLLQRVGAPSFFLLHSIPSCKCSIVFLIHSFADGHLGCFQHLAIVNCAAMKIEMHRFFGIGVSGSKCFKAFKTSVFCHCELLCVLFGTKQGTPQRESSFSFNLLSELVLKETRMEGHFQYFSSREGRQKRKPSVTHRKHTFINSSETNILKQQGEIWTVNMISKINSVGGGFIDEM